MPRNDVPFHSQDGPAVWLLGSCVASPSVYPTRDALRGTLLGVLHEPGLIKSACLDEGLSHGKHRVELHGTPQPADRVGILRSDGFPRLHRKYDPRAGIQRACTALPRRT